MTRVELWQTSRGILEEPSPDSHGIRVGVLLLGAFHVGPNIKRLRTLTGVPLGDITRASYYLRRARIWIGANVIYAPWADDDTPEAEAAIGFVMQTMVGTGDLLHSDDRFKVRTVDDMFGLKSMDTSGVNMCWRDLVPLCAIRTDGEVPAWVRRP